MSGKSIKKTLFALISLGFFLTGGFFLAKVFLIDRRIPVVAGLRIVTTPRTKVFVNGQSVGESPFNKEDFIPGEYTIRVEPIDKNNNVNFWQAKVNLVPGSLTYINRTLAANEDTASGQTVWLDKIPTGNMGELAVVSVPNKAKVYLDGVEKGESSLILKDLAPGDHEVKVVVDGYSDQVVYGKIMPGHRLNVVVSLSKNNIALKKEIPIVKTDAASILGTATPSGELLPPYIIVKDTPTGFLRARSSPTLVSSEAGRLIPGSRYPIISEVPGWTEISFEGKTAWVNDQYLDKKK